MKLKYIYLFLILILLFNIPAESNDSFYIGSFKPEQELNIDFLINFNTNDNNENFLIEFQTASFRSDNQNIPLSRLNLLLKNQKYVMKTSQLRISKNQLIKDAAGFLIPFNLKLQPIDKPGTYFNQFRIKDLQNRVIMEGRIVFTITSLVRFEKADKNFLKIADVDFNNQKIESNKIVLKIASNSSWELFGYLEEELGKLTSNIQISLRKKIKNDFTKEDPMLLNKEPKLLTNGTATVNNQNYWTEIEVILEVDNFQKIKSGMKNFPIVFHLNKLG